MRGKLNHIIRNMGSIEFVKSINIPYIPYVPHVPTFTIGGDGYISVTDLINWIVQILRRELV